MDREQAWTRIVNDARALKAKVDHADDHDESQKVWIQPPNEDEPTISFRVDKRVSPPKMIWLDVRMRLDDDELTLVATPISFVGGTKTVDADEVYIVDITPKGKMSLIQDWNVLYEGEFAAYFLRRATERLDLL